MGGVIETVAAILLAIGAVGFGGFREVPATTAAPARARSADSRTRSWRPVFSRTLCGRRPFFPHRVAALCG